MNREKTVVLFTGAYPYKIAGEEPFLDPEIGYLSKTFDKIIIIPALLDNTQRDLAKNIEVENDYADCLVNDSIWRKISSGELQFGPSVLRVPWSEESGSPFYPTDNFQPRR